MSATPSDRPCPACGGKSVLRPEIPTYDAEGVLVPVCDVCGGSGRLPEEETASPQGEGEQPSAAKEAESVQGEVQPKKLLKSGVDPSYAGKLRWAKAREREAAQEEEAAALSSGKVLLTRTPVHVGDIIARLNTKAKTGDVQAARELREWMREYPADDETDMSALDARTRQRVLARVLADIAEEEGEAPAGPVE